ncbi:MAG: polysaccharide deacetylase family protein [Nitrospira sp.]|nr:polysaccharide deacetylase family protein [Nitrospira sp.]
MMQRRPKLITNVETQEPIVALTFDDGPHPEHTSRVLHVLEKYHAKATFFMVGKVAQKYPEIVRKVAEAGHVIGNHSWDHQNLTKVSSRLYRLKEMWACARATNPYGQKLFRPPFGAQNDQVLFDAKLLRYKVIMWNVSAQDWVPQRSEEIAQKMIDRLKPGNIFLLHDAICDSKAPEADVDREPMIQGLDQALSFLSSHIHFVTVPALLLTGKPVSNWPIPHQP